MAYRYIRNQTRFVDDFIVIDITTAAGAEQIVLNNYEVRKKVEFFDGISTQIFTSENGNVTSMPEKLGCYFRFNLRTQEDALTRSKYHKLKYLTQVRYTATFTLNYFTWSETGGLPTAPTGTTPAADWVQQSVSIPCVFKINENPVDNTQRGIGTVSEEVEITAWCNTCNYTFPDATPEAFIGNDFQAGYFVEGACPNLLDFIGSDDGRKRFVIEAYTVDGNPMLNELGHVVRLTWYNTDTPSTLYVDITTRIGTNLATAVIAGGGTTPATLPAGQVIDHLGDFDASMTGLKNYLISATVAHGGEIIYNAFGWMTENGWHNNNYARMSVKIQAEEDGKIGDESSVNVPWAFRPGGYGNSSFCYEFGNKTFVGSASNSQVAIVEPASNECGDPFINVQEQTEFPSGGGHGFAVDENEIINGFPTFYYTLRNLGDKGIYMVQHNGGTNFLDSGNWTETLVFTDATNSTQFVQIDPLKTSNGRPWLWVTTNVSSTFWILKWDGVSAWTKTDFATGGLAGCNCRNAQFYIDPSNHDIYLATVANPVNVFKFAYNATVDGEDNPANYTGSKLLTDGFTGVDGTASGGGTLGLFATGFAPYKNASTGERQFLVCDNDIDYLRAVTWAGTEYEINLIAGSTTGNSDGSLLTAQFEQLFWVEYDSITDIAKVSERTPNDTCRVVDFGLNEVRTVLQGTGSTSPVVKY